MLRCGLSAADFSTYVRTLRDSHSVTYRARLLDLDRNHVDHSDFGDRILGGSVDIDTTRSPVRSATIDVYDPTHALHLDTNGPGGGYYYDRIVSLSHVVWVPDLGKRVSCPLITGPISGVSRDGNVVTITVQGMEALALGSAWTTRQYAKGTKKSDVIRRILADLTGETAFAIPDLSSTLGAHFNVARLDVPWSLAKHVAQALDRQLYYDASGRAVLRVHPSRPAFTFYEGDRVDKNGHTHYSDVLNPVQIDTSLQSGYYDTIEVVGPKPKAHATRIRAVATRPVLYRNGVALRRAQQVSNDKIKTVAEAKAQAERLLKQQEIASTQVTADVKVMPFLEEGDVYRIQTAHSGGWDFRPQQWSIPLGESSSGMSLGHNENLRAIGIRPRRGGHKRRR